MLVVKWFTARSLTSTLCSVHCTASPPPPPFLGPLLFVAENGLEGHGYWVLGQPGYIGEEADRKMWWLIGRAPDYCGKSPGFESFLSREGRQSPSWGQNISKQNSAKSLYLKLFKNRIADTDPDLTFHLPLQILESSNMITIIFNRIPNNSYSVNILPACFHNSWMISCSCLFL